MGMERFSAAAQDACVDGALIIDLPVEESRDYLSEMQKRALATVFLAAPTSTDARLKQIAEASSWICVRGFADRGDRGPAADA